jgi:hypothetical protein
VALLRAHIAAQRLIATPNKCSLLVEGVVPVLVLACARA